MVESFFRHRALPASALALLVLALIPACAAAAPGAASIKGFPPRGRPPSDLNRAHASATPEASAGDYRYSWALGYQRYPARTHVTGFWALQQNAQPDLAAANEGLASPAHSIGQVWAIARHGSSCMSDVEMGWTVSSGQYGDLQPHLFVYAWDCGVGLGYVGQSSIPWVQYSDEIAPNAVLPHDSRLHLYGMDLYQGNWWFYYDGEWLGYIPSSAWTRFFPSRIQEGEVGGEIATPQNAACAAMGNEGLLGTDRHAALVGDVWYQHGGTKRTALLRSFSNDTMYRTGNWQHGQPGPQFRYGGPGWCGG
jgi:hypothetical protein